MEEMNMTKIRQILNHIEDQARKEQYFNALHCCNDLAKGLLTNLQIAINRPLNQVNRPDACPDCKKYHDELMWCRTCGKTELE